MDKTTQKSRREEQQDADLREMLKTEDGQLNVVFACFGSAAQHAQIFEEALTNFLTVYKRAVHFDLSTEGIEEIVHGLHKKTMGQLLHDLKGIVKSTDGDYIERMEMALKVRNFLMHRWFLERKDYFKTKEGRIGMVAELVGIEKLLDSTRVMANAMRIALCKALRIEDAWLPKDGKSDDSEQKKRAADDLHVKPATFAMDIPDAFADRSHKP
jgi:hypothetical protein